MMPALFALYSLSKSWKNKINWWPCLLMLTQRGVFLHRTQIERKCSTVDVTSGQVRGQCDFQRKISGNQRILKEIKEGDPAYSI